MSGNGTAPGTLPDTGGYAGLTGFQALVNQFAALDGLVRQIMAGKAFAAIVAVTAVSGGGADAGPPTVNVRPLVNQIDGLGNQTPHGIVNGLPVFRLQGGPGAFVLDPVVGDIGLAVICDRDISAVKATGAQSGPGSWRTNSWADGCYFGGYLNAAPASYVQINAGGVNIQTAGTITINAGGGTTIDGKPFLPHVHTGVQSGGDDTGPVG